MATLRNEAGERGNLRWVPFPQHKSWLTMADNETLTNPLSGPEEPQSSTSQPSQPDGNPQGVRGVPTRPQAGYDASGTIDTSMLGSEPIGPQQGKNGPARQKFICSACRQKRWIIDSAAGCSAKLHRFSICDFCAGKLRADRELKKQWDALVTLLDKLRASVQLQLADFEAKIHHLEGSIAHPPTPPPTRPTSPTGLRIEFDSLKAQLEGEVRSLKSLVEERPQTAPYSPPVDATVCSPTVSVKEAEDEIDRMYRRITLDSQRTQVSPVPAPQASAPNSVPLGRVAAGKATGGAKKKRTRKKKKKRNVKAGSQAKSTVGVATVPTSVNLVIGDSLVGGETARYFYASAPLNRVRSFPGARVSRAAGEVEKLTPSPRNTLILAVGGNDFYRKDGQKGAVNTLLNDFDRLLKVAKSKTGRVVVIGLVPRKFVAVSKYTGARAINNKLAKKCKDLGFRFIDPWDTFFGKDELFRGDGVHFSDAGAQAMAKLMKLRLHGAPKTRRRRKPAASKETARPVPLIPPLPADPRPVPRGDSPMVVDVASDSVVIPVGASPEVRVVQATAPVVVAGPSNTVGLDIPSSPPVTRKRGRHQSSPGSISSPVETRRPAKKGREGGDKPPSPNRVSGGEESPRPTRGREGAEESPSPGNVAASGTPLTGGSGCSLRMPDPSEIN